jgi:hypothetical protein
VNASGPSHQLNVGLSNVTDPGVDTGHIIRFRAKHTHASLGRITIQLRQDSDVVYATAPYVTDSIGDYEIEVPETRIADITDYTDLNFSIRMYSGSVAGTLRLYEIELQVGAVGTSGTDDVSRLVEIEGQLFAARGTNTSQIDPGATEEVEVTDHGQVVTDVSGAFAGEAYLCFGQAQAVRKVTGINASGATFTAVTSPATVKAYLATVGADRIWLSNAGGGDDDGKVQYALTAVTSATLSNAFTVGNPDEPQNGITAVGERMMIGFETGVNSFTAAGAPVRLIESLKDSPSTANGRSGDYIWGWAYVPTRTGLWAVDLDTLVANPVGPGEGIAGRRFESAIGGYPTAVRAFKDRLWVSYRDPSGDSWIIYGLNGPQTASTGRPLWYGFKKLEATMCNAIGASGTSTNPLIFWGEGTDVGYAVLGRGSTRDIDDPNYRYAADSGEWYGTTMMRTAGMLANVRAFRFLTEDCDSNNSWTVKVSVDEGAYVTVGTANTNGLQTVRPVAAGVPLTTVNGSYFKPRLTRTSDDPTDPPRIRGFLDMVYDERPETIEEHAFMLVLGHGDFAGPNGAETEYANLVRLIDRGNSEGRSPQAFRLPGATEVDGDSYGLVTSLSERIDLDGKGTQGVVVTVQQWDTA